MLDINDASIDIYISPQGSKELLISYKSININTFTVVIFDISQTSRSDSIIFMYECFQLWEQSITGFLIADESNFMMLNTKGMTVLNLGGSDKQRVLNQTTGQV